MEKLNFDEEARKLFRALNLEGGAPAGRYQPLNPVWRNASTGGTGGAAVDVDGTRSPSTVQMGDGVVDEACGIF